MPPPRRFGRRWLLVGAGTAALVAAGSAGRWLPVTDAANATDPVRLRDAVLGGVVPHTGVAQSAGGLGLPDIPNLETTAALLSTTTRIRVQVAAADRWRADQLTPVGEIDAYRIGDTEYVWDYGFTRLTTVRPIPPVRLPRASDLTPSDLARRLLTITTDDPVSALPARRIAGYAVPGLRVTPADPEATVGRIDVWALPVGGDGAAALPMAVEVAARGVPDTVPPAVATAFLSVTPEEPPDSALRPQAPPGAETVTARAGDLAAVLRGLNAPPPPDSLAGRPRVALPGEEADLPGVGVYGTGVGRFVLVPTGREVARQIIGAAGSAGGVPVPGFAPDRAVRVATPLLGLAVVRRRGGGHLLAGPVTARVLEQAVGDLVPGSRP